MKTKFCMLSLLVVSLLLGACNEKSQPESAKATVAVVDVTRALRDSDAGKAGMKFLEDTQNELQKEISALQNKSQTEGKKDKDAEAKYQQELQVLFMTLQQRMQAEQQNVISVLNDTFQRVLEAQRAAKDLRVIVPTESVALAYDKAADITDAVIAAMNKEKVEFTPVTSKAEKAMPAEAEEAEDDVKKPEAALTEKPKAEDGAKKPEADKK